MNKNTAFCSPSLRCEDLHTLASSIRDEEQFAIRRHTQTARVFQLVRNRVNVIASQCAKHLHSTVTEFGHEKPLAVRREANMLRMQNLAVPSALRSYQTHTSAISNANNLNAVTFTFGDEKKTAISGSAQSNRKEESPAPAKGSNILEICRPQHLHAIVR